MRKIVFILTLVLAGSAYSKSGEVARWEAQAKNITITRDDFGIAHVVGKSDADAVFGALYAQAEDDFNRIETNYLNALGRLAEAEGEEQVFRDLRMKLFLQNQDLKLAFKKSPKWLQKLMVAFADGLNYYLYTHPLEKPRVITHFEPWMALAFSEGSIGGDIERVDLGAIKQLYGEAPMLIAKPPKVPEGGSNGIAIAPSRSANGHALLLINPHTSFYFRSELQMTSQEGLNAYGAATWGQFFIYQGFNEKVGWMHTSSTVDAIDEYADTDVKPSTTRVKFKTAQGMSERDFKVFRSKHGPVVRKEDGKWIAVQLMQRPVEALMQSFLRTKATSVKSFEESMHLKANSSNNVVLADAAGNIAFYYANFVPKRDSRFDWTKPVDGRNPHTSWQDLLSIDELPKLVNPKNGWICNTNNWPWSAAGKDSINKSAYPGYIDAGVENARGVHAMSLLEAKKSFDLDGLIALAYDSYLSWFTKPLAALFDAYDKEPSANLADQIKTLRAWDQRWSKDSVATSLAVYWAHDLMEKIEGKAESERIPGEEYVSSKVDGTQLLKSLEMASSTLSGDFGTWQVPWAEINRLQRISGDIDPIFSDTKPSLGVPFTAGKWGSLAAFAAKRHIGSRKMYGTSGNSFMAVVEFAKKVRAKAINVGGGSGHPSSKHFNDQSERYVKGELRDVYFYPEQRVGHVERVYQPGA